MIYVYDDKFSKNMVGRKFKIVSIEECNIRKYYSPMSIPVLPGSAMLQLRLWDEK